MKRLLLSVAVLMSIAYSLFAQCPPPNFPNPGYTCQTAPVLCPTLDGYCVNTGIAPPVNPTPTIPGCQSQYVFNNPIWFGFFAGTTTISIHLTANNCVGSQNGIQAGIYDNCISQSMALQCACSNDFTLTASNFVVGEVYWFFIDGCGGADCDISIDVTVGSTVSFPPNPPTMINGPITACGGTSTAYNVALVPGATSYAWTTNPPIGTITTNPAGNNATIAWPNNASGPVDVCVAANNACYPNNPPICTTIVLTPKPTAVISGSGVVCAGGSGSPANLTVTFTGEGPWTFTPTLNGSPQPPAITTNDNPYTLSVTQAGNWGLQGLTGSGCAGTTSGVAPVTLVNISPTISPTAATCGQSNGNLNLTVTGGATPYDYDWSNGETTEDLTGFPPGTYTVTVTDNNGCTKTQTATINNNPVAITITPTITANTTCIGGNGSISVNVSPGTLPYTYAWNNGETTTSITGLTPGTYTITVTGGLTCTQTASFTVPNTPNQPNGTATPTGSTCALDNGAVNLTPSGGIAPYMFSWSNGETTEDLSNLLAGTYTVTITGDNGCTRTVSATVSNTNPPFTVTPTIVANTTCNGGNGSISLSVAPASGTYTFSWANGEMTNSLTGLTPGSYAVTVSAGGACTQALNYTIPNNPNQPNGTAAPTGSTCALDNGAINLTPSGGVAPYTFSWSNGETTEDLTNLLAGSYTVTITGDNGCTRTVSATVSNTNPPFTVTPTIVANNTCNGGNGSISLSAAPASGTYTYSWANGETSNSLTGLTPGSYAVTVSAGGACTQALNYTVPNNPNLPNGTATPTGSTCALDNGAINLTPSGGVAPYTFSWSNGEMTEDLSNLLAGSYTVTITGDNGCTRTVSATVSNTNPPFTVTPTIVANNTCNGGNGSISLSAAPASGTYTYSWANGETSNSLTGLTPGSYAVTVSAGGACTQALNYTVPNNPNLPNGTATPTGSTCALDNGAINLTPNGGISPYTFAWSNGETTEDLTNLLAGSYTVTITGDNGCTRTVSATVSNTNPPFTVTPTIVANTTCTGGNGSVTLNVAPASGTYTFSWANGETTNSLTGLTPGSYPVTVSAGGACTQTVNVNIPNNPNLPNVNAAPSNSTCALDNGAINLTVSGGVPPYTFEWSNGAMTEDLNGLAAGNYIVTVTGDNGCTRTASVNVSNFNPPITLTPNIVANTTCNGGNGSITVNATPAGTYTYTWDNGNMTNSITGLEPGPYVITVSAGGACTQVATYNVPNNPNNPNATATTQQSTCELPNGSINVTVTGGVTPYTYTWASGQITQDLSGILAGMYELTVTGANGCTDELTVNVNNNNPNFNVNPNVVANTNCGATGNGLASVTVTPPGTYTYQWFNGATTANLSNLLPGTYTLIVSAGGACTREIEITVPDNPNEPNVSQSVVDATCGQSNGSINITVSGGQLPYQYQWSSGQTVQDLNNVPPDNYLLTVTGANGCSAVEVVTVDDIPINVNINGNVVDNTSCFATSNGSIVLSVFPANAMITWLHNNSSAIVQPNLPPGTYTVVVSAGGTCTETESFTIDDNSVTPNLFTDATPAVCGLANGSINLTAEDGALPYKYLWSNGKTTQDINNVAAGDYTVTVTTALGCTSVAFVNVPGNDESLSFVGLVNNATSCVTGNGSIILDVIPEGYNYTYLWSNGRTTENVSNLAPGIYTVTATLGTCSGSESFEIELDAVPPNLSTTVNAATCGIANGSATAVPTGGQTPYTYKWSNNTTTATASNLAPGTYTVTVTGSNGCTVTAVASVPNNSITIAATGAVTPNTSCVTPNGAIDLTATPAGYTFLYHWSNSSTMSDLSSLAANTYTVTVTYGNSCSSTASFVVDQNTSDPIITPAVTAAICGQSDGAIDLTISGAPSPYQYNWSNSTTNEDLSNILAGNYTVTVTAQNGCTSTQTMNVANNSSDFTLSGTASPLTNCANANGSVNLTITPAGSYQIVWSTSAVTEDLSNLMAGTFTVTVTKTGTCSASASFVVEDQRDYPSLSQSLVPETCGLANGSINLSVTGNSAPYGYSWNSGQMVEDLNNISGGNYTVTVTGANQCTATTSVTVPDNAITFSVSGNTTPNTSCTPINGAIDLSVSPAGTYQYAWSTNKTTEDLSGLDGGTYTVTVSAGGTCTSEASFVIVDNTPSPLITPDITAALCGYANGSIQLSIGGNAAPPYSYSWSNGATTSSISNVIANTYSVTVTASNGCSETRSMDISDNAFSPNVAHVLVDNTSCTTPNGSLALTVTPANYNYTYVWSLPGQTNSSISNLSAGTYSVTVSAGAACTAIATYNITDDTEAPVLDGTPVNALCSQPTGSVNLEVTGATLPYQYKWSNGATVQDISNLLTGNYTVTVTGANGCQATASFNIGNDSNNFAIVGSVTQQTSCTTPNGAINVTMVPTDSYTFKWSNNATTEDISALAAGTYTVTVIDATACAISETFTVGENIVAVSVTGDVTNILCFGEPTGAISVTVNTGTPPYQYNWNPQQGGSPAGLNGVVAGTYRLTVTDFRNCTATAVFNITQPATGLSLDCDQSKTVSAPGMVDGEGTVTISGGAAPYDVKWSPGNGNQLDVNAGPYVIPNLGEGSYSVTVTDANGCTRLCGFNIGLVDCNTEIGTMSGTQLSRCGPGCLTSVYNPQGQFLEADDKLQFVLHTGNSNQIVGEIARNSTPSFCFNAATMTFGTTYYISAVAGNADPSGNVLLNDFCTVVSFGTPMVFFEKPVATIATPAVLNCEVQSVPVQGTSTIANSTFDWTTITGQISGSANTATISATEAGLYQVIVTAGICKDTADITVNDLTNAPQAIVEADPSDILDCKLDQIILVGQVEGSLNANTVWMLNGQLFTTQNPVPINTPGTYAFVILDTLSRCTDTAQIVINQNLAYPPLGIVTPQELTCSRTTVTLNGSSPFPGIGFQWARISGTDTTIIAQGPIANVTQPGEYFLIGFDLANGCTNIDSVTVTQDIVLPSADAGAGFNMDCFGQILPLSGSAGGGASLTILWTTQDGAFQSGQQTLTPLITKPGTYLLIVTNTANGCTDTDDVVIIPNAPTADLAVTQPPCFGDRGRIAITNVVGGAPPVRYSINDGPFGTQTLYNNLTQGVYTIRLIDSEGCSSTAVATIIEPPLFELSLVPQVTMGIGDEITLEVFPSIPVSDIDWILWTPSDGLSCDTCFKTLASPLRSTRYEVNAANENGCKDRAVVQVLVDTRLNIYAPTAIYPGSAVNSNFTIFTDPKYNLKINKLQVFSRWGEMLFTRENFDPNQPELGWDGTHKGQPMNPAVFVWYAVLTDPGGNEILLKGDVTVVR